MKNKTRFIVNGRLRPITLENRDDRIFASFPYCKPLIAEIKAMMGSRWHKEEKIWSFLDCERNRFNIEYLTGGNPFARWEQPLQKIKSKRKLYKHQQDALNHLFTRRRGIYAGEMGVGKTLVSIEAIEIARGLGYSRWLWVAPKSALAGVELEFRKWGCPPPEFSTYASLGKVTGPFSGIVFDECQRLKNANTKRSVFASDLTEETIQENGFIFMLSGTPAPKNPCDWWNLCELPAPGFLKEGSADKLKYRLGRIEHTMGLTGNTFPRLVNWFDRPGLCKECGYEKAECTCRTFIEAENEVSNLGRRMKGLTMVHFKKDCLDLPEKIYEKRVLPISAQTRRLMTLVTGVRAVETLSNLRMLSDGFQYKETETGKETACPVCEGRGFLEALDNTIDCKLCGTSGIVSATKRETQYIGSPKEAELVKILDEYSDVGKVVIFGGFQGSVDLIMRIVKSQEWDYVKVDGRGWETTLGDMSNANMLDAFQTQDKKIAFIAQAGSGGTGITLTASPVIVYYSNSFNAEDRMQSEDRIHRAGMDVSRGAKIIDLVHLETDELILENLKKKKDLQSLSMEKLREVIDGKEEDTK